MEHVLHVLAFHADFMEKLQNEDRQWVIAHTFSSTTQKTEAGWSLSASLVYRGNSGASRSTQRKSALKNQTKQANKQTKKANSYTRWSVRLFCVILCKRENIATGCFLFSFVYSVDETLCSLYRVSVGRREGILWCRFIFGFGEYVENERFVLPLARLYSPRGAGLTPSWMTPTFWFTATSPVLFTEKRTAICFPRWA